MTEARDPHHRRRPRALHLALALALVLAPAGCGSSASEESRPEAALRIERAVAATGEGTELVVSVEDPEDNVAATADGRRRVTLECVDSSGAVLVRGRQPWPFTDTDDGLLDAHVHQPVPAARLDALRRCRLAGTRGPLAGRITGPGVR